MSDRGLGPRGPRNDFSVLRDLIGCCICRRSQTARKFVSLRLPWPLLETCFWFVDQLFCSVSSYLPILKIFTMATVSVKKVSKDFPEFYS